MGIGNGSKSLHLEQHKGVCCVRALKAFLLSFFCLSLDFKLKRNGSKIAVDTQNDDDNKYLGTHRQTDRQTVLQFGCFVCVCVCVCKTRFVCLLACLLQNPLTFCSLHSSSYSPLTFCLLLLLLVFFRFDRFFPFDSLHFFSCSFLL